MWWRTIRFDRVNDKSRRGKAVGGRDLEQRIRSLLRSLDVRPPLSVPDLCHALARSRGRAIELRPYPMPAPGPLGLWIDTEWADVVIFQTETTPLHQDHIILHEIGHILADHRGLAVEADHWADMLPGLKTEAIRRVLQRCTYGTDEENEAELVATIIGEWASVLDHVTPTLNEDDAATQRVVSALGDQRGWL